MREGLRAITSRCFVFLRIFLISHFKMATFVVQKESPWSKRANDCEDLLIDIENGQKNDTFKLSCNNFEYPPLYQPSLCHKGPKKEVSKRNLLGMKPPQDSKGQSFLLQSIELQHYKRRMTYMLSAAQSHQNEMQKGNFNPPVLPLPPLPPKRYCSNDGHLIDHGKPSFLAKEFSAETNKKNFRSKYYQCPMQLDNISSRQLLLKSVAAVTAHSGFESVTESSLHTLTDIAVEFTLKFCQRLKSRLERKSTETASLDELSHVLRQCLSEDLDSLHNYWLTRIKNVALKIEKEDLTLLNEYNSLKDSSARGATIKEEKA